MSKQITHPDLSQPIYLKLKEMILKQELLPGEKIVQEKIAASLGVSRTPLNKALQRLEQEILVESIPRRGMYVKKIDLQEMMEIFQVREGLESVAARLICDEQDQKKIAHLKSIFTPFTENIKSIDSKAYQKADEEFHTLLINYAGNEILERMYFFKNMHDRIVHMGLVRQPEETMQEHQAIIKALEDNKSDLAAESAAIHIRKSTEMIKLRIENKA